MLRILGFDKDYVSAQGLLSLRRRRAARIWTSTPARASRASATTIPACARCCEATLAADLADGVQIHYSVLAGMLAEALTERLPDGLDAVFFASTGAEAVDSAMKFARAATGRPRLISCDNSFHGVTLGPLSLVGDEFFKEGFGPLLPGCERVPFGDLARLEKELRAKDVAAFIVEPIQGRMVTLPPPGYLKAAQELCRRYGTLFVADEIQTGPRAHRQAVRPRALGPRAGLRARRQGAQRRLHAGRGDGHDARDLPEGGGTLERSYVHQSTYGRNRLSMAAGLATLRIIERDGLVEHAARMGSVLLDGLAELQQRYEMVKEVRGSGLMIGIELGAPSSRVARVNWRLIHLASEGLFPQLIVIPLHRDHGVITMAAGKNDVIKLLPPLTLSEPEAQASSARSTRCSPTAMARPARTGAWCATSPRRGCAAGLHRSAVAGRRLSPFRGTPIDSSRDHACLVTGASGFIGGHLAQRLVQDGYQVRCLVRASSDTSLLDKLDVEIAVGDLESAGSLTRAAEGCRYVLHCGALVSDWAHREGDRRHQRGGHAQHASGLRRTRPWSASSTSAPPTSTAIPAHAAIDETYAATRFRNWYAQTKLAAEGEVRRAGEAHALDTVILRPATVYGPRSTEVVGEIARAMRGGNMLLVDRGRAVAGLCYVDNLVDAALLALRHEAAPGQAFNATRRPGHHVEGVHRRPGRRPGLLAGQVEPAVLGGQRHRFLA